MNRALTLKWFAVLGLASLFYLLAPRDVSPQMPLYLGMTSAAVIIWTFDLIARRGSRRRADLPLPADQHGPTRSRAWAVDHRAHLDHLRRGHLRRSHGKDRARQARGPALYAPHGGTFTGMLIGFAIGGIILGLLLASGFARTVIFCAIAVGIIRALDIDPKSRLSSIIVIACFFAAAAPTMQFLHTSESFIWSFQVLMKAIGGKWTGGNT